MYKIRFGVFRIKKLSQTVYNSELLKDEVLESEALQSVDASRTGYFEGEFEDIENAVQTKIDAEAEQWNLKNPKNEPRKLKIKILSVKIISGEIIKCI